MQRPSLSYNSRVYPDMNNIQKETVLLNYWKISDIETFYKS